MDVLAELDSLARSSFNAQGRWWVELLGVERLIREGDLDGAAAAAIEVHERWPNMPPEMRDDALQLQLFVAMFLGGQYEELEEALRTFATGPTAHQVPDRLVDSALLTLEARRGATTAAAVETVVTQVLAAPPGWRRPAELHLVGQAAFLVELAPPTLIEALERHAGTWVLLGTSIATLGPIDAVLANLHALSDNATLADEFRVRAATQSAVMRSPWWADTAQTPSREGTHREQ